MMGQIARDEQVVFDTLKYRIDVEEGGTRRYFNNAGKIHRIDGPAIVYAGGTKYWMQNGILHRTDGPAIEIANGHREWWQNGQRHRTDGPAIEYATGDKRWFINGEELTEAEFNQEVKQNV